MGAMVISGVGMFVFLFVLGIIGFNQLELATEQPVKVVILWKEISMFLLGSITTGWIWALVGAAAE